MPAQKFTLTFGGWYQRTTLHLTEIFEFLSRRQSRLDFDRETLRRLHRELSVRDVQRQAGPLEFIRAQLGQSLELRYFEDGLYILETTAKNLDQVAEKKAYLEKFFEEKFNPAIAYIFSLGAPTPKILANIKTAHPTVVATIAEDPAVFKAEPGLFGEIYSQVKNAETNVIKTADYIFVVGKPGQDESLRDLAEMQIFFREFKDQLEKYLNIHRQIWEEIAQIKERKIVRGQEVREIRLKLDAYQKTVNLIGSRLNQMGTYVATRRSLTRQLQLEEKLITLFQYKFETLADTHAYIKELWQMTKDYLATAIQAIVEIENQSTNASLQSLRTITTIGVIASITAWLSRESLPNLTLAGLLYFALLLSVTALINKLVQRAYRHKKYRLNFTERKEDI